MNFRSSRHSGPPREHCHPEMDHRLKSGYHIDLGYEHLDDMLGAIGA
jgi:hypothetical protein